MANQEHLEILDRGVDEWNNWRTRNPSITPNLEEADLRNKNLQNINLKEGRFINTKFDNSILVGANFTDAYARKATFCGAKVDKAVFEGADLMNGCFKKVNFTTAVITNAKMQGAILEGAIFDQRTIKKASFGGAKLMGASFINTKFEEVDFSGADASSANFTNAILNNVTLTNTNFQFAFLINTNLNDTYYSSEHKVFEDNSDKIKISRRDRYFNWSRLRKIGEFPLFGVSWTAFIISITAINLIGSTNKLQILQGVKYPIPIPERMIGILLSSILLTIGSTLYKLLCPERVQEFSEVEWVEKYNRPRLLYLKASWTKSYGKLLQPLTLLFTIMGGVIAFCIVIERVYLAFKYIVEGFF